MVSRYGLITKIRPVLENMGMIEAVRRVNQIHHYAYHLMTWHMAKKRKNGYVDKRYGVLKQFKNIHCGKRCFIVCTGPSLLIEDVERLKNEITFSMNSIYMLFEKTDWRPTYYAVQDSQFFDIMGDKIWKLDVPIKFLGDNVIYDHHIRDTSGFVPFPLEPFNHWIYKRRKPYYTEFSNDIYAYVSDGATVTYTLMQIAVYMGIHEIYLLGCDCNYKGARRHVVDFDVKIEEDPEKYQIEAYGVAKKYADAHGIRIMNATRGGMLEVFERVNLDDILGGGSIGRNM